MVSKVTTIVVILLVGVAGTGLTVAYHDGLFTAKNSTQAISPTNPTSSNNTTTSKSNNTTSNSQSHDNVFVNQVQSYLTISDSQGIYVNYTEQFSGFKMMAGNSTNVSVDIRNNNFFNITLNRIAIQTNGFDLENITPLLPKSINSSSSMDLKLQIFAQSGVKSFNGSIQMNVLGNRTTSVSVPSVHLSELGRNKLDNNSFYGNLSSNGFISSAKGKAQVTFLIYNNNTFALNISAISSASSGFSINSTYPKTYFVVMPNESKNLTVNITISASRAGYHNSINLTLTENATLNVDITSVKVTYEYVGWTSFPSTYFVQLPSHIIADGNFTVQFGLQEYCGPMDAIEITGFSSHTSGITMVSESVLYPTYSFPVEISCDAVGFSVTFHISGSMAGYQGQLNIYATDG